METVIGIATRAHPYATTNGDKFVIKRWNHRALVSVIDGLGHRQHTQHFKGNDDAAFAIVKFCAYE